MRKRYYFNNIEEKIFKDNIIVNEQISLNN